MKNLQHILTTMLCVLLVMFGQANAETGHDAKHEHGAATLSLDHGKKWSTDEPLRKAMENLRTAFAAQLDAIHHNELSADGYKILGERTAQEVGNIVAQCKLKPEADAVLHLIIADMLAGADIMQNLANDKPRAGAHKVVMALQSYGQYFDHPGWKNLE